jgi:hypothetical protein
MNKSIWSIGVFFVSVVVLMVTMREPVKVVPVKPPVVVVPPVVVPVEPVKPVKPVDPELVDVQVPIPHSMRVFNYSGSQCVWCTLQALGNYHNVKGTTDLINKYKWATGASEVNRVLTSRNVKFKQVINHNLAFIKEWVTEKKMGVGIGVNGGRHMITLVHYEEGKCVKVFDNGDRKLGIQTWSWSRFTGRGGWDGWAVVVLPDDYQLPVGYDKENDVDNGNSYRGK